MQHYMDDYIFRFFFFYLISFIINGFIQILKIFFWIRCFIDSAILRNISILIFSYIPSDAYCITRFFANTNSYEEGFK